MSVHILLRGDLFCRQALFIFCCGYQLLSSDPSLHLVCGLHLPVSRFPISEMGLVMCQCRLLLEQMSLMQITALMLACCRVVIEEKSAV